MGELLWKIGSEDRLRQHIIAQDKRFQAAMRAALGAPALPKQVRRLAAVAPPSKAKLPHDVIDLKSNAALLRQPLTWKRIIEEVCIKHQVTRSELIGPQRSARISSARQEAMYRMKTETTMSLPQIGHRLGNRDHTTVLHGVRRYEAKLRGEVYRQPTYGKALEAAGL
jgi:chromosomal replication initiation ATPase DnaA